MRMGISPLPSVTYRIHIFWLVFVVACDQDSKNVNPQANCPPNYQNQNLKGVINGDPWEFQGGFATVDTMDGKIRHLFYNFDSIYQFFPCGFQFRPTIQLTLLERSSGVFETGEYRLFNPAGTTYAICGFLWYDSLSIVPKSKQTTCGAFEILNVDTTNGTLTARIDVYENDNFYANGNFTIAICDL